MTDINTTDKRKDFGKLGEDMACEYLIGIGCEVLERNYETYSGEIDIIARDGETIVFAEVKTRKNKNRGRAALAVTRGKLSHIASASAIYMKRNPRLKGFHQRIDVIEIYSNGTIEHIRNVSLEGVV